MTILLGYTLATAFAQAPQAFSFQAVMRDSDGNLLSGKDVTAVLSILQGNPADKEFYRETFQAKTDAVGVLSLAIGTGVPIVGKFTDINWKGGAFYVKTSIRLPDDTKIYDMGMLQLLSVPYALYANEAGNSGSGGNVPWKQEIDNSTHISKTYINNPVSIRSEKNEIVVISPLPDNLEAGYLLINADGKEAVLITSVLSGSGGRYGAMGLLDQNEQLKIGLYADKENAHITVKSNDGTETELFSSGLTGGYSSNGAISYSLVTDDTGSGKLRLMGPNGVENVFIGTVGGNENTGGVYISNRYGKNIAAMTSTQNSRGAIAVLDENETLKGEFLVQSQKNGSLRLYGANGTANVSLGSSDENASQGGLWTFNPAGNYLVKISSLENNPNNGYISIYHNGTQRGVFCVMSNGRSRLVVDEIYDTNGYSIRSATADYSLQTRSEAIGDPCYVTETGDNQIVARGTATLKNGSYTVTLPRDAAAKIRENTLTVQVTPLSAASKGLAVVQKETGSFTVSELMSGTGSYAFDWTLTALRRDDPALRSQLLEETGTDPATDSPVEPADPKQEKTVGQRMSKPVFPNVRQ
jgi:hypothetical protein